jgi:hypothetical protein
LIGSIKSHSPSFILDFKGRKYLAFQRLQMTILPKHDDKHIHGFLKYCITVILVYFIKYNITIDIYNRI